MQKKRAIATLLAILALVLIGAEAQARQPNVIVIFTDDQGSVDMGCYGTPDIQTPHMDSLAARGVRFTQFYAAAPVCSPSRAGMLTGRYPVRAGMPGNASAKRGQDDASTPHEVVHWQAKKGPGAYWAIRHGDWKLMGNVRDTSHGSDRSKVYKRFLVNLANDPGEQHDLSEEEPRILKRLEELHTAWAEDAAPKR